jgi:hypothetical protein
MERSFRTVYIPKKLAGTRDGERRKPPRQVEEEEDDDDEAGEAAAANAGQEPPAMVRIKLPHAITSAVQTSFQDLFSTIGLCYQSVQIFSPTKGIWQSRQREKERERENCSNDEVCSLCTPLRWVALWAKEGANGWSERASEELGDAQWIELGGTRCSHVLCFSVRTNGKSGNSDKVIYYRAAPGHPPPLLFSPPFFFNNLFLK